MKKLVLMVLALALLVGCGAPSQYVRDTDSHDALPAQPEMQYNTLERRWEFVGPGYELKYNNLNTRKGDMQGEWSYQPPQAQLRYNALEEEWQWSP